MRGWGGKVGAQVNGELTELKGRLAEIADLERVGGLLGWDQQAVMPPASAGARAHQRSTVRRIAHERFVSDAMGDLLERLDSASNGLPYDGDDVSLVRIARRDYIKERQVPAELAAEMSAAATRAHEAWVDARERSDFERFLPHLEESVELRRRYLDCFEPSEQPYDLLLDDYEPGATTHDVAEIFAELREGLVPLIAAIAERSEAVDASVLDRRYPIARQEAFVRTILERLGFEKDRWRLDPVVHPFAMSASVADIRITTRYFDDFLPAGIFGAMHEFGHGLYEAGIDPDFERSPLGRLSSLSLHESQSRLWENFVGRSLSFWKHAFPELVDMFPEQLDDTDAEAFYRAVNRVEPSLIRVEADEATYNLHIILRFELEQSIVAGEIAPRDLPAAWDERMLSYLGVTVPDDAHGVLQDPHWCFGFGYFPTYALGNLIAAQLWQQIEADLPTIGGQIADGEFSELRRWLGSHIHRPGGKFTMKETLERVLGEPLSPQPYLTYLRSKLGAIYGLP